MTFYQRTASSTDKKTLVIYAPSATAPKKRELIPLEAKTMKKIGTTTEYFFANLTTSFNAKKPPGNMLMAFYSEEEVIKLSKTAIKKDRKNGCDVLCITEAKKRGLTIEEALKKVAAISKASLPYDEVHFKFDLSPEYKMRAHDITKIAAIAKAKQAANVDIESEKKSTKKKTKSTPDTTTGTTTTSQPKASGAVKFYASTLKKKKKSKPPVVTTLIIFATAGEVPQVGPKIKKIGKKAIGDREIFFKGQKTAFDAKSNPTNWVLKPPSKPKKSDPSILDRVATAQTNGCDAIVVQTGQKLYLAQAIGKAENKRKATYKEVHCEFFLPNQAFGMMVKDEIVEKKKLKKPKNTKTKKEEAVPKKPTVVVTQKKICLNKDKKQTVILHSTARTEQSRGLLISSHGTQRGAENIPKFPCDVFFKSYENFSTKGNVGSIGSYHDQDWVDKAFQYGGGNKEHRLTFFEHDKENDILRAVSDGFDVLTIKPKSRVNLSEVLSYFAGKVKGKNDKDHRVVQTTTSKQYDYTTIYCLFCRS